MAVCITARAEVVLAAGAINSPKILMLSGNRSRPDLAENGVPVVADRPGVGQNLQDHLEMYVQFARRNPSASRPTGRSGARRWSGRSGC
jgi:choline dehydrogenase